MNKKIVVLFSGTGSNLRAICEYAKQTKAFDVVCAITNNPNAGGIHIANEFNIQTQIIEHTKFSTRKEFDIALIECINQFSPNLVVLAGFMRILTPIFTQNIKAVNIHPSLLPLYPGANAISESFSGAMKVGGVTIHWVSEGVDEGEIIAQEAVVKLDNDTFESFKTRIHETEWGLYPKVVDKILQGRYECIH